MASLLILLIFKIKKFLQARISRSIPVLNERHKYYFVLLYFGYQSEKLRRELDILLSKYFFNILFKIISVNKFTIGPLFSYKASLCYINFVVHSVHLSTWALRLVLFIPELPSMRAGVLGSVLIYKLVIV